MGTYALLFAYDGTGFRGFARQNDHRTVQGELERWLTTMLRAEIALVPAGRTDAGVHAAGQVVSFSYDGRIDLDFLLRGLNKVLSPEMSFAAGASVEGRFSARFDAKQRDYVYRIYSGPGKDPFLDRFALWVPEPLDVEAMDEAAQALVGSHDFTSFCRANDRTLVRRIKRIRVRRAPGKLIVIRVSGNAFCHQMVRSFSGSLIRVGAGKLPVSSVAEALAAKDRSVVGELAHARGLTLMRVHYRPDPFR